MRFLLLFVLQCVIKTSFADRHIQPQRTKRYAPKALPNGVKAPGLNDKEDCIAPPDCPSDDKKCCYCGSHDDCPNRYCDNEGFCQQLILCSQETSIDGGCPFSEFKTEAVEESPITLEEESPPQSSPSGNVVETAVSKDFSRPTQEIATPVTMPEEPMDIPNDDTVGPIPPPPAPKECILPFFGQDFSPEHIMNLFENLEVVQDINSSAPELGSNSVLLTTHIAHHSNDYLNYEPLMMCCACAQIERYIRVSSRDSQNIQMDVIASGANVGLQTYNLSFINESGAFFSFKHPQYISVLLHKSSNDVTLIDLTTPPSESEFGLKDGSQFDEKLNELDCAALKPESRFRLRDLMQKEEVKIMCENKEYQVVVQPRDITVPVTGKDNDGISQKQQNCFIPILPEDPANFEKPGQVSSVVAIPTDDGNKSWMSKFFMPVAFGILLVGAVIAVIALRFWKKRSNNSLEPDGFNRLENSSASSPCPDPQPDTPSPSAVTTIDVKKRHLRPAVVLGDSNIPRPSTSKYWNRFHGQHRGNEPTDNSQPDDSVPIPQVDCSRVFGWLLGHEEVTRSGLKDMYLCTIPGCNRSFTQKGNLNVHIKSWHLGEKKFKCRYCSKRFARKQTLANHQRVHNDVRPFKCTTCERSFRQNSQLARHLRTHSGVKPFLCDCCGKKFADKRNLKSHFQKHHNYADVANNKHLFPRGSVPYLHEMIVRQNSTNQSQKTLGPPQNSDSRRQCPQIHAISYVKSIPLMGSKNTHRVDSLRNQFSSPPSPIILPPAPLPDVSRVSEAKTTQNVPDFPPDLDFGFDSKNEENKLPVTDQLLPPFQDSTFFDMDSLTTNLTPPIVPSSQTAAPHATQSSVGPLSFGVPLPIASTPTVLFHEECDISISANSNSSDNCTFQDNLNFLVHPNKCDPNISAGADRFGESQTRTVQTVEELQNVMMFEQSGSGGPVSGPGCGSIQTGQLTPVVAGVGTGFGAGAGQPEKWEHSLPTPLLSQVVDPSVSSSPFLPALGHVSSSKECMPGGERDLKTVSDDYDKAGYSTENAFYFEAKKDTFHFFNTENPTLSEISTNGTSTKKLNYDVASFFVG